jgi:hypothetical protein
MSLRPPEDAFVHSVIGSGAGVCANAVIGGASSPRITSTNDDRRMETPRRKRVSIKTVTEASS